MKYSQAECRIIRESWAAGDRVEAIRARLVEEAKTQRSYFAIVTKAGTMDLPCRLRPVPKAAWIEAAKRAAEEFGVPLGCILADDKRTSTVHARWQAWKALYGDGKRYSLSAIGRCVGVDHSSVFHARERNFEPAFRRANHPNSVAARFRTARATDSPAAGMR